MGPVLAGVRRAHYTVQTLGIGDDNFTIFDSYPIMVFEAADSPRQGFGPDTEKIGDLQTRTRWWRDGGFVSIAACGSLEQVRGYFLGAF